MEIAAAGSGAGGAAGGLGSMNKAKVGKQPIAPTSASAGYGTMAVSEWR